MLESDFEKIKLKYEIPGKCKRDGCEIMHAIDYFLSIIDRYIKVEESSFYLVVKDITLFTFKYEKDKLTLIENSFYTYGKEQVTVYKQPDDINTICFTITDDMNISIKPRTGYCIKVRSDNSKYY